LLTGECPSPGSKPAADGREKPGSPEPFASPVSRAEARMLRRTELGSQSLQHACSPENTKPDRALAEKCF